MGDEGVDGMFERAEDAIEADAGQADLRFGLVAGRCHQHDRRLWRHHLAGVLGEAAAQADVDRATQVPGGEGHVLAGIDHDGPVVLVGEHLAHREARNVDVLGEEIAQFAVAVRGEREVQRGHRLSLGDGFDELVFAHRSERVVGATLLADRRHRLGRQVLAARRAGAVGREHLRRVGQREQLSWSEW